MRSNRDKADIEMKHSNIRSCTSRHTSAGDLPQYEAEAVHVGHDVGLEMVPVQSLVQNLRSHEAFGALSFSSLNYL